MTKEQETLAERLVAKMKKDGQSSIDYEKYVESINNNISIPDLKSGAKKKISYNDMTVVVEALEEMEVIAKYPDKPKSIRFREPYGSRFTTFSKYKFHNWFKYHPILGSIAILILGILISFILTKLTSNTDYPKVIRVEPQSLKLQGIPIVDEDSTNTSPQIDTTGYAKDTTNKKFNNTPN